MKKHIFLKTYFLFCIVFCTTKTMRPINLCNIPFGPQRDAYVLTHNIDGTKISCQNPLLTVSLASLFAQLKKQEHTQRASDILSAMATYHTTCKNPCFLHSYNKKMTHSATPFF